MKDREERRQRGQRGKRSETGGKERKLYKGEGNLINTSLNHPIWRVIVQYSQGKWHLSALMLSFSVETIDLLYSDLLNQRRE